MCAGVQMNATENHTSTANGTEVQLYTTPVGSATTTLAAKHFSSGGMSVGTTAPATAALLNGEISMPKTTNTATAPGAAFLKIGVLAGTNAPILARLLLTQVLAQQR